MFSTWGALTGLAIAIVLIVRKATPAYALVLGALLGGLLGGGGLPETVGAMIGGAQSMMPSVLRILTSGVLAGALVKTGSAEKIADAIVRALGTRFALRSSPWRRLRLPWGGARGFRCRRCCWRWWAAERRGT